MSNTFIALDIGTRSAHALWLTLRGARPVITRKESFALPMDEENPDKLIATWVDSIGLNHHFCTIAMPGAQSLFQTGRIMPNDPRTPEQVAAMDIAQFSEMAGDEMRYGVFSFEPSNEPQIRRYILSMARPSALDEMVAKAPARHFRPADLVAAPVALYNAVESMTEPHDKPWCYIAIGDSETQIAVGVHEGLLFARSIPVGGKMFTDAIVQATGLPPVQAEVRKHADCGLGAADACSEELRLAADRFVSQLNAALGVYKSQFQDRKMAIEKYVITGGGAQLKGFKAYLEQKLFLPVQFTTEQVSAPMELEGENGVYDIAYGLALTASRCCIAYLSLLPDSLKDEVVFRQKKPWWIAGALSLLGAIAVYSVTGLYLLERDTKMLDAEKAKLAMREKIDKQIQATRQRSAQIITNSVPLSELLVNGPLARAVLTLVAQSVDPNDWITLFCDEKIYNPVEQAPEEKTAKSGAAAPAPSAPFSLFRSLRAGPAEAPKPRPVSGDQEPQKKKDMVDALSTVFIVEGYTPNPNLKSVKEMITRLKTAQEVKRVDLRGDDQVLAPTGIPELEEEKLPNFRRFVIEIEVNRP
ncbi:MAG: pilus assembly protein PilM [Kiritimatiellae bacterium]|nr:pilus assembly protein PilM [Kiritimatiellia bacterium]